MHDILKTTNRERFFFARYSRKPNFYCAQTDQAIIILRFTPLEYCVIVCANIDYNCFRNKNPFSSFQISYTERSNDSHRFLSDTNTSQ
jgi:hypothetical protein